MVPTVLATSTLTWSTRSPYWPTYAAGPVYALTSDALEEWHRYALPAFTDRMRQRVKAHCEVGGHSEWPGQGRHTRS